MLPGLDPSMTEFLLPFLLVLAIVYGALSMGSPFKNKGANFLIALVFGFFAASYAPAVQLINQLLQYAAVVFVAVFVIGFVKSKVVGKKTDLTLLAIAFALLAIFLAGPMGQELFGLVPYGFPLSTSDLAAGAGLLFVLIILAAAYKNWSGEKSR